MRFNLSRTEEESGKVDHPGIKAASGHKVPGEKSINCGEEEAPPSLPGTQCAGHELADAWLLHQIIEYNSPSS